MNGVALYPERQHWRALGGRLFTLLGYADDVAIISRDLAALRIRLLRMEDVCSRAGVSLSTKAKLFQVNTFAEPCVSGVQPRDLHIDTVTTLTYLGSEFTWTPGHRGPIHDRLTKAQAAFALLRRIWDGPLPMRIKFLLYHSLVRPVALYGVETWTILPANEGQLDALDMECLRRIYHIPLLQHLINTDTRGRAQSPVTLSEACGQHRLRYYGRLSRIPNQCPSKIALWNDAGTGWTRSTGTRPRGGPLGLTFRSSPTTGTSTEKRRFTQTESTASQPGQDLDLREMGKETLHITPRHTHTNTQAHTYKAQHRYGRPPSVRSKVKKKRPSPCALLPSNVFFTGAVVPSAQPPTADTRESVRLTPPPSRGNS